MWRTIALGVSGALWALSGPAAATRPAALVVSVHPQPGAPCLAGRLLAEALRRRGLLVTERTGEPSSGDDLVVSLSFATRGWRLRVARASGSVVLLRKLPELAGRCPALAETGALIVQRFLDRIRWTGRPVSLGRLAPPARPRPPASKQPATPAPAPSRFGLFAGGAARLSAPADVAPELSFEVSFRPRRWLRLAAAVYVGLARETPVEIQQQVRGFISSRAIRLFASAGLCRSFGAVTGCAGLLAGASLLHGSASETLYQRRDQLVSLAGLGAFARVSYPLPGRLELAAELAAVAPLGFGSLTVEGTSARVSTAALDVLLSFRLGWYLF